MPEAAGGWGAGNAARAVGRPFYLIDAALALPSWWLVHHTRMLLEPGVAHRRRTLGLNPWLAITLFVLGLHNLPLAPGT